MLEVVRYAANKAGVHPSDITKTHLKSWGLETPLVQLCGGSPSRLRALASVGAPPPAQNAGEEQDPPRRVRNNLSNAIMSEVWTRDAGKCVQCGSTDDLEFDHIVPFSKGGSSTPGNLRILCLQCNRRRGARI